MLSISHTRKLVVYTSRSRKKISMYYQMFLSQDHNQLKNDREITKLIVRLLFFSLFFYKFFTNLNKQLILQFLKIFIDFERFHKMSSNFFQILTIPFFSLTIFYLSTLSLVLNNFSLFYLFGV